MQYTVTRGEKGKVDIKVDIPQATFEQTYQQVLAEFKKETKIAGFRPGMAPDDLVEGQVGSNKILNEAASFLISRNLADIFKKEDLVPLDNPKIAIATLAKSSPFSFTASFILKPEVKIGDWKKLKINKIKTKEITEDDITNSIKNIFEAYKKSQSQSEKSTEEEGAKDEGKYILDSKGNKIVIPEDARNKVEMNQIDDVFAKKIGARDLAHLKELVKKDLETLVAEQIEADHEQKLFSALADLVEVEVPEMLVDDELNRILVRLGSELERQSKTLEDFLKEEKTTIEDLKTKWRDQAANNVKISMAMDQIGKEAGIKVTKEELEAAISGVNQQNISADQKRDMENYLVLSIFQAKTLDFVKKTIAGTLTEKPSTETLSTEAPKAA